MTWCWEPAPRRLFWKSARSRSFVLSFPRSACPRGGGAGIQDFLLAFTPRFALCRCCCRRCRLSILLGKGIFMFCSECGNKVTGRFCSSCGRRLESEAAADTIVLPSDWSDIIDYQSLLEIPEVRDAIARNAAHAKKSLTGEELLEMYFKALGKM